VKVVVLGGSAAGPNTGAGCSGYLIVEGETSVAIDLGPGTLPELRRHVDFRSLSAIVITHYHLDHILDIGALRYLGKYNPDPLERQIPLHVPPGTAARFASWAQVFGDPNEPEFLEAVFAIGEYDPSESLRIGEVSIEMKRTVHPVLAHARHSGIPPTPVHRSIWLTSWLVSNCSPRRRRSPRTPIRLGNQEGI
jgi:ribonuclease BN (tRNA processing enzyme)